VASVSRSNAKSPDGASAQAAPRNGVVVSLVFGLCTLSAVFGFFVGRRHNGAAKGPAIAANIESSAVPAEAPPSRGPDRLPVPRASRPEAPPVAPARPANEEAHEVLSGIRAIFDQRSSARDPLEASVNRMDDYLIGAVAAIRSTNPAVFSEMAQQFTDDICSKRHSTDRDLMLFSRLVLLESDVGTVRAVSCSLEGRRREDPLLWALLTAWNSVGRPDLPDIRAIGSSTTDDRTKRLLMPPEERLELDRKQAQEMPPGARDRDIATARFSIGRARRFE